MIFEIAPNLLPVLASSLLFTILYSIGAYVTLAYVGLTSTAVWNWGTMLYWAQANNAPLGGPVVLVRAAGDLHRSHRYGTGADELRYRRVHQSASACGRTERPQSVARAGLPRRPRLGFTPVARRPRDAPAYRRPRRRRVRREPE